MKKRIFISTLLLTGAMMLSSCGTNDNIQNIDEPVTVATNEISSNDNSYGSSNEANIFGAYNDFVCSSLKPVLVNTDSENVNPVYSPLSVYMAFSLAAESAYGDTQKDFLDVLGASDIEDLRNTNAELYKKLSFSDNDNADLTLANSLWFNSDCPFKVDDSAVDSISEKYKAAAFYIHCATDPDAGKEISNWISENTNHMIKPDVQTSPDDILRIINAIHFKDSWYDNFKESNNIKANFTNSDNKETECTFLSGHFETNAAKCNGYTLCELKMLNGFKMTFALSDENSSLKEMLDDEEKMNRILNGTDDLKTYNVNIQLPKFDVKSKYDLLKTADDMGIPITGDYSSFYTDEGAECISKIIHEAAVNVDENGCEAAAYTEVVLEKCDEIQLSTDSFDFILDRPFFYNVTDENGTSVICGAVNDPSKN